MGYADGVELSIGPGGSGLGASRLAGNDRPLSASYSVRNSPTILNSGYIGVINGTQVFDPSGSPLNWHINRRSLEAQAFGPLANPPHMRGKGSFDATTVADTLVKRLKAIAEYVTLFDGVFGGGQSAITKDNIGKAIAAYERSLVTKNSPYDRYVAGQTDALTDLQKQGLIIFFGEGNCANCHSGPMFSDFTLYNLGVKYHPIVSPKDKGALAQNLFRTPTLRNVSLTAPYMHNGTIGTLREVVDFYNKGVSENDSISRAQMSVKVQPLHLSEKEKEALVAFLEALTDNDFDKKIPAKVPSGLKVGGN
ncbi:hypothetical protein WSM22_26690 [Cytophagales bacterium WSM2-2]|nr:hypothetical protein WSM22_26690 [Cytophagales bacterium WSM2-2]